jgi:dTDP-4-amino-4,6-dideoxygalactose transaminase
MRRKFSGSFTQQEPVSPEGIAAALEVLEHGRLHRYNVVEGETAQTALLEEEFARATGTKFALAVASGGYAIGCALRASGVVAGDNVLTNAFTLAPVPGAIAGLGAVPVFVGVTDRLTIDLGDLEQKIAQSGAKILLLSHMRGHICDMERLMEICDGAGGVVIEDCAIPWGRGGAGSRRGGTGRWRPIPPRPINI